MQQAPDHVTYKKQVSDMEHFILAAEGKLQVLHTNTKYALKLLNEWNVIFIKYFEI